MHMQSTYNHQEVMGRNTKLQMSFWLFWRLKCYCVSFASCSEQTWKLPRTCLVCLGSKEFSRKRRSNSLNAPAHNSKGREALQPPFFSGRSYLQSVTRIIQQVADLSASSSIVTNIKLVSKWTFPVFSTNCLCSQEAEEKRVFISRTMNTDIGVEPVIYRSFS